MVCWEREETPAPSLGLHQVRWCLQHPQHRPSEASRLLLMLERGCVSPRLPGMTPAPLPPQWDRNAHAPAELALKRQHGSHRALAHFELQSTTSITQTENYFRTEKKRHLRQLQFTINPPKCLYILLAFEVAWTSF